MKPEDDVGAMCVGGAALRATRNLVSGGRRRDADEICTVGQHEVEIGGHGRMLSTVLGSCVAVCLHARGFAIGGMSHLVLPTDPEGHHLRFTVNLIELQINGLMRSGAARSDLQAKLFGGATIHAHKARVGARTLAFARQVLADDGIPVVAEDTGGSWARAVRYWPETFRVQLRRLSTVDAAPAGSLADPQSQPPEVWVSRRG